jgi:hypothetical protein
MARLAIPLSKKKITLAFFGSWAFVGASVWLWHIAERQIVFEAFITTVIAEVGISFSGLCVLYASYKLFDWRPGLILDADGFVDNSSGISAGRVPWDDVIGIKVWEYSGQRALVVLVHDPQKYIDRAGYVARKFMTWNQNLVGSPIAISASALAIEFDELERVFVAALEKSKHPREPDLEPQRSRRSKRPST